MPKLFLISGLGADERLFKHLDLSGFEVVNVTWLKPDKKDSLASYATRLINEYGIVPQSNVIGVSLGGLITVEVAKQVELGHAIVISSIKNIAEAPWHIRFFRAVPVHKLVSGKFFIATGFLFKPLFGHMAGKEGELFYNMLKHTDPYFIEWAINAILTWDGKPAPGKIEHIIGSKDAIFSNHNIPGAVIIPNGDHMMVFNRAREISPIIRNILNG